MAYLLVLTSTKVYRATQVDFYSDTARVWDRTGKKHDVNPATIVHVVPFSKRDWAYYEHNPTITRIG